MQLNIQFTFILKSTSNTFTVIRNTINNFNINQPNVDNKTIQLTNAATLVRASIN